MALLRVLLTPSSTPGVTNHDCVQRNFFAHPDTKFLVFGFWHLPALFSVFTDPRRDGRGSTTRVLLEAQLSVNLPLGGLTGYWIGSSYFLHYSVIQQGWFTPGRFALSLTHHTTRGFVPTGGVSIIGQRHEATRIDPITSASP